MKLKTIGITLPYFINYESDIIRELLESEVLDRFHIRKTDVSDHRLLSYSLRTLIESIPSHLHSRLSLHDCHEVAVEYGCGIHLNSRNPLKPIGFDGITSRSCHSLEEILKYTEEDYLFLSPIYPSLSKPGYKPAIPFSSLKGKVCNRIYALGGVTPQHFNEIAETGFGGAVMLGVIWEECADGNINKFIERIRCFNS
ncbi:MAG: thiamine phosphate synthase [Muribaculaceae bacterium]|nr:thiamine phosphate synthase [Muribaculaceae bacterium]